MQTPKKECPRSPLELMLLRLLPKLIVQRLGFLIGFMLYRLLFGLLLLRRSAFLLPLCSALYRRHGSVEQNLANRRLGIHDVAFVLARLLAPLSPLKYIGLAVLLLSFVASLLRALLGSFFSARGALQTIDEVAYNLPRRN